VGQSGGIWGEEISHTQPSRQKFFITTFIYIDNMHETLFSLILSGTLLGGIFFYLHSLVVKIKNIIIKKKEKPPIEWTD
jgi:hypothetical protein